MFDQYAKKSEHVMYAIFRILVGFMFATHGLSKLGLMGKPAMTGIMAFVGVGELLVGLGILLGLFTRLAALGGLVIVAAAYFKAHLPSTWNPLSGGGELALMFLVAFLVLFAYGGQKFSLGYKLFKKEFW